MSADHKPCGCLTDGYNWLAECAKHRDARQSRNDLLAALKEILDPARGMVSIPASKADAFGRARAAIAIAEGR